MGARDAYCILLSVSNSSTLPGSSELSGMVNEAILSVRKILKGCDAYSQHISWEECNKNAATFVNDGGNKDNILFGEFNRRGLLVGFSRYTIVLRSWIYILEGLTPPELTMFRNKAKTDFLRCRSD